MGHELAIHGVVTSAFWGHHIDNVLDLSTINYSHLYESMYIHCNMEHDHGVVAVVISRMPCIDLIVCLYHEL